MMERNLHKDALIVTKDTDVIHLMQYENNYTKVIIDNLEMEEGYDYFVVFKKDHDCVVYEMPIESNEIPLGAYITNQIGVYYFDIVYRNDSIDQVVIGSPFRIIVEKGIYNQPTSEVNFPEPIQSKYQDLINLINEVRYDLETGAFKGEDGVGIDHISFQNYQLTFHLTNGTTFTTPSIRGEKGEQGERGESYVLTPEDKREIAEITEEAIKPKLEAKADKSELSSEVARLETEIEKATPSDYEDVKKQVSTTSEKLEALWKLSEGQVYDFVEKQESGMNEAPSGARYFTLEETYGKSEQGENPTPTNPQEIKSVEEINVEVVGKNLYKGEGILFLSSNNKFIENSNKQSSIIKVKSGQTLSSSFIPDALNSGVLRVAFSTEYPQVGVSYERMQNNGSIKDPNGKWTATQNGYIVVMLSSEYGYTFEEAKVQIEFGQTPTSYEPYHSITHTITPPRPLNKIGDYVDKLNVDEGVWEYEFNTLDLGTLKWSRAHWSTNYQFNSSTIDDALSVTGVNSYLKGLCSNFKISSQIGVETGNVDNIVALRYSPPKNILEIRCDMYDNAVEFKNAVSDKELVYAIANTTTEPINEADLLFLRSLETLSTDNHIILTDQNGEDISYLLEYIRKLNEVA